MVIGKCHFSTNRAALAFVIGNGQCKGKVNHKMRIRSKTDQTRFDFTTAKPGLCQAHADPGKADDLDRDFWAAAAGWP